MRPAPADAEEGGALIGRPRCQHFADIGSDIACRVGLEIIAIGKIDFGRRDDEAVHQRMALGVEHPERLHLRKGSDQLLQPQMQLLLAGDDISI